MSSSDGSHQPNPSTEPAVVLARIRRESTRIKQRELDVAVRKLEASGEISGHERAVIEEMADRIVARLLAPPIAALEARDGRPDPVELETLTRLFEPATDPDGPE